MAKRFSVLLAIVLILIPIILFTGCPTGNGDDDGLEADKFFDVVVVGSGVSGYMSAISAKKASPSKTVLLIEKADYIGGTTRLSSARFQANIINASDTSINPDRLAFEALYDGIMNANDNTGPQIEPKNTGYPDYNRLFPVAYLSKFVQAIFIREILGIPFNDAALPRFIEAEGNGSGFITNLDAKAKSLGIEIYLNCKAESIIVTNGAAAGIRATKDGNDYTIAATDVILCTGGFSKNLDLINAYKGQEAGLPYVISSADSTSTGEGVKMAKDAGAAIYDGSDAGPNSTFTDVYGTQFSFDLVGANETNTWCAPSGGTSMPVSTQIIVNSKGERIKAEDTAAGVLGWWFIHNADQPYFVLYDTDTVIGGSDLDPKTVLNAGVAKAPNEVFTGQSIEELANAMSVPTGALSSTVDAYNGFVQQGSDTQFGKAPANLSGKIDAPPYYAAKIYPRSYGTQGGIKTTVNGQALKPNGAPFPHLYAAGEVANRPFFNQYYQGGSSVALYSSAGYITGKYAVEPTADSNTVAIAGNPSGIATASAHGYAGTVTVTIIIDAGYITTVVITGPGESPDIGAKAIEAAPAIIKSKNSFDIDTISGASFTCSAIISAGQVAINKIKTSQ
jgi:succinate dehydrogenase/fumarate reductase flavoprotein subunit